jgi:hypothetical protein
MWQTFIAIGVLIVGACGHERRGGAGESCTKTDDCNTGLGCFAQVCTKAESTSEAGAGDLDAGSDSCGARRDCASGFTCVAGHCQRQSVGTTGSARYSGKGESCQVTNDCTPDLSCVMGMCREVEVVLSRVPKSCFRVECATKDDCCQSFVPNANCPTYEMNCAMDPIFCNTYRSLCQCGQDCVGELCIAAAPGCKSNAECTSTQTPFCVEGKCRQCDKDAACSGDNAKCSEGVCMAACHQDEHCPLLHACQDGACVDTGCKSDRECAFIMKNPLAVCRESECHLPCATDDECMTAPSPTRGLEVCEQGQCVFVGCENDRECRALLGLENQRGNIQAVCR